MVVISVVYHRLIKILVSIICVFNRLKFRSITYLLPKETPYADEHTGIKFSAILSKSETVEMLRQSW